MLFNHREHRGKIIEAPKSKKGLLSVLGGFLFKTPCTPWFNPFALFASLRLDPTLRVRGDT